MKEQEGRRDIVKQKNGENIVKLREGQAFTPREIPRGEGLQREKGNRGR